MAIKTYGNLIYRVDDDGEKVPFKVSAKTLVIYKEFTGSDLITDMTKACNVDMNKLAKLNDEELKKEAKKVANDTSKIDSKDVLSIMQNLILSARLAAYPTNEEMQEALLVGEDILPASMLFDMELGIELLDFITKETTKKKIK